MNKTEYNIEYAKTHTKRIPISLNTKTDADILQHLESKKNVQGYIKELIREDMRYKQYGMNKKRG